MARATAVGSAHHTSAVSSEDALRAGVYRLLAQHLSAPPDRDGLASAARLTGDDTAIGQAVTALARIAQRIEPTQIADEYQDLFIGLGRGELVPYASYYLTGFLNEKPLSRLRQDMAELGIERSPDVCEPEDHAASVLEIMAGLIDGAFGQSLSLGRQRRFYERHVSPWMGHFFRDLQAAKTSVFYGALGGIGTAFLDIEEAALRMDDGGDDNNYDDDDSDGTHGNVPGQANEDVLP